MVVIDLRGDLVDRILRRISSGSEDSVDPDIAWKVDPFRRELLDRLCLIDLRKEQDAFTVGINPLIGPGEHFTRAYQVLDIIRAQYDGLGVQVEDTLRYCLLALAEAGLSIVEIEPLLTDAAIRATILAKVRDPNVLGFFERYDEAKAERQQMITGACLNKISPLIGAVPAVRLALGSAQPVNWRALIDRQPGSIVLVSLGYSRLRSISFLLGRAVLALITQAIFSREDTPEHKRVKTSLYIDEFQNVATPDFEELVAECRRFGVAITVAHQSRTQIPRSLSTLISDCFKVKLFFTTGAGDAKLAAQEVTGSCAYQAKEEIMQFRTGEAFLTMHGAETRRIATFQAIDPPVPPARMRMLQTTALRHYGRPSAEVSADIRSRLQFGRDDDDDQGGYRHGKRPSID